VGVLEPGVGTVETLSGEDRPASTVFRPLDRTVVAIAIRTDRESDDGERRDLVGRDLDRRREIVEGSPYDKIWGVGLHWASEEILDEANWEGLNWLGDALMEVRRMLKHDEAV